MFNRLVFDVMQKQNRRFSNTIRKAYHLPCSHQIISSVPKIANAFVEAKVCHGKYSSLPLFFFLITDHAHIDVDLVTEKTFNLIISKASLHSNGFN